MIPSSFVPYETPNFFLWDEQKAKRDEELRRKRAEIDRRNRIASRIIQRPGLFYRLTGKVVSYLNENAKPRVGDDRELLPGIIVPKAVHLDRLSALYREAWQARLKWAEEYQNDLTAAQRIAHARERLALLKRGHYICIVDHKIQNLILQTTRKKKTLFGREKTVKMQLWVVSCDEYDRRLRLFVHFFYSQQRSTGFFFQKPVMFQHVLAQFLCAPDVSYFG